MAHENYEREEELEDEDGGEYEDDEDGEYEDDEEDEDEDDDRGNLLDPDDPADVQLVREALASSVTGKPSKGLGHTLVLLLVSLFLFWTSESASTGGTGSWIAALVLVLVVHEGGHFIAMKAFGFTDLKVFFIPFIGAAASGRKIDATPTQRALVSLMGPLPGIVLAFGASFLAPFDSQFLADVVVLALVVNAFNLLPLLPLDGGAFLHWTLFARWPSVRWVIRLINAVALIGVGRWLDSWILLGFGALLLFGAFTLLFDGTTAELPEHVHPGEELSITVPDRLVPIAMAIANRRRFAKVTHTIEPKTYAITIAAAWGQIHRVAPIPVHRTLALLVAYVGAIALVPAALVRLVQ
ncbi:site-2 protease family protein [Paraliomyxa miuraensis]|uniref:site-2 protease family protein n=1 Tax=Paraliomyxa miuraensis TaxID=376150 RepID=UPI00225BB3D6|nr:site-2 protease family protein [Paraliomyxa miuraensis]MCX4239404.1 hypothetical protein [Paraliomyxa miuraensis]